MCPRPEDLDESGRRRSYRPGPEAAGGGSDSAKWGISITSTAAPPGVNAIPVGDPVADIDLCVYGVSGPPGATAAATTAVAARPVMTIGSVLRVVRLSRNAPSIAQNSSTATSRARVGDMPASAKRRSRTSSQDVNASAAAWRMGSLVLAISIRSQEDYEDTERVAGFDARVGAR